MQAGFELPQLREGAIAVPALERPDVEQKYLYSQVPYAKGWTVDLGIRGSLRELRRGSGFDSTAGPRLVSHAKTAAKLSASKAAGNVFLDMALAPRSQS